MTKNEKTTPKAALPLNQGALKKILKYHFQFFIFVIFGVVAFMIFNVYQILNAPTDDGYYQSKKADLGSSLDIESMRAINRLYFSDEVKEAPANPEDTVQ